MAPIPSSQDADVGIFHPKVIALSLGITATAYLSYRFYRRYLKPVRTILDLTPERLEYNHKLYGYVTRVGDGDNFRFFHTPGGMLAGWGWLKSVPKNNKILKNETLMIRLCGIDAPERAHFGKPAQPYSEDALQWLKSYILGRYVVVTPYLVDQYKRIVGKCQVWKWTGKKDVSAAMLKQGMAIVYEGKVGAEFGDNEDWYRRLEKRAKFLRRGVWSLGSKMLTPGDYKKTYYRGD